MHTRRDLSRDNISQTRNVKRIKLERIVDAIGQLRNVGLTKAGQWLPGFLCLRAKIHELDQPVTLGGTDFADFMTPYYWVPSAPDPEYPWFDPLQSLPWKYKNWPRGSFYSRSDSSHLVVGGAVKVVKPGNEREFTLLDGYHKLLSAYFKSGHRIPILDFAAWMLRNEPFNDNATAADVVYRLTQSLNLSDEDITALFNQSTSDEDDASLFTDQDWPIEDLTQYLPPPPSDSQPSKKSHEDTTDSDYAGEAVVLTLDDNTFVKALLAHLHSVENFEVDENFLRAVLAAIRVDRFVVLCGKPGTGKTEFVHSLHRALAHVLRGVAEVFLVHHEVHPETAEWELIGARDLAGEYVPSPFMRDLTTRGGDDDLHIVLLDEMNRGLVDSYAGRLLAAISNGVPLDLPGRVTAPGFPTSGRWEPRAGVLLFAAINSPLTEPARLPLSGPVKRRAHLLSMPDPLEKLTQLASEDYDEALKQFKVICTTRLIPQLRRRLLRRGTTPALDGDLDARFAKAPSDVVLDHLWQVVVALGDRIEVAFTLGVVQSIIAFVLANDGTYELEALDQAILSKVVPHLQGDLAILEAMSVALGAKFPNSQAALDVLRTMAEENGERVNPMY
jgi:hypothetical protein